MLGEPVGSGDDPRVEMDACLERFIDRPPDERLLALTHRVSKRQHEQWRSPAGDARDVHGRVDVHPPATKDDDDPIADGHVDHCDPRRSNARLSSSTFTRGRPRKPS